MLVSLVLDAAVCHMHFQLVSDEQFSDEQFYKLIVPFRVSQHGMPEEEDAAPLCRLNGIIKVKT